LRAENQERGLKKAGGIENAKHGKVFGFLGIQTFKFGNALIDISL